MEVEQKNIDILVLNKLEIDKEEEINQLYRIKIKQLEKSLEDKNKKLETINQKYTK